LQTGGEVAGIVIAIIGLIVLIMIKRNVYVVWQSKGMCFGTRALTAVSACSE
jgi:hypothetical protein